MVEFAEFPKIGRLSRNMVVTEKIDGTNAQIHIVPATEIINESDVPPPLAVVMDFYVYAGSRNRYLTLEADNFGFARWVHANAFDLAILGPGRHYGEWWGPGIQRGYGLKEKRFSLFNVGRWTEATPPPACCSVVPIIYEGPFSTVFVEAIMGKLERDGSVASPGFMRPEGVIVFQTGARTLFKKTFDKDEMPKSLASALIGGVKWS